MKSAIEIEVTAEKERAWHLILIALLAFNVWKANENLKTVDANTRELGARTEILLDISELSLETTNRLACVTLPRENMSAKLAKSCDDFFLGDFE